jgi:O-antigen/teichoic acid export membrane protein
MYSELIEFSYPLMFSGIVWTALSWGDTFMIGYFMDDASVGLYDIGLTTAALIGIPASALGSLALPSFSDLGARGSKKSAALKTTTRWSFVATFPIFLLMILFSEQLLQLLFGPQYAEAGAALAVIAVGTFFANSTGQMNAYLKSDSHTKLMLYNNIANLVFNLSLNLLLIPTFGIIGAAIATAASTIFVETLLIAETYRLEGVTPFNKQMLKALPAGAVSLASTYIIFQQLYSPAPYWILIPAGITFMTVYTLIFLKIGGLTEYDKELIITSGRKIGKEDLTRKALAILT